MEINFEWNEIKNVLNQEKHGVSFEEAQLVFLDSKKIIVFDTKHSDLEHRYLCIGKVDQGILTVRFTYRIGIIRIFGAAFWRKGKKIYYEKNKKILN